MELKLKSETTRQQKNQKGKYVKTMRLKSGVVKAVAKSQIQPTNVLKSCLQQHSFEKNFLNGNKCRKKLLAFGNFSYSPPSSRKNNGPSLNSSPFRNFECVLSLFLNFGHFSVSRSY